MVKLPHIGAEALRESGQESWVSTRDGNTLSEILREEISAVLRLSAGGMDASLSPDVLSFNETEL